MADGLVKNLSRERLCRRAAKGGGEKKSLRIINGRCSFRLFGIVLQSVNENSIMKIRFFEKGVKEGRRPSGDGRKGMEMIVLTVGGLPVYLFGCIVTGGILAGLLAARWGARLYGAPFAVAVDILLASLPLGLIGARVGYPSSLGRFCRRCGADRPILGGGIFPLRRRAGASFSSLLGSAAGVGFTVAVAGYSDSSAYASVDDLCF